jgi:type II secretory pathway pseudopilin PulG
MRARRDGLSLLEVVVALGILGFGILALGAAQITSMRFNHESYLRTEGAYLAEQQMEAFHMMDTAAVEAIRTAGSYPNDPGNPIDPDTGDGIARSFTRSWTITPDTPETDVYTIEVVVRWVDGSGTNRDVSITSLKAGS